MSGQNRTNFNDLPAVATEFIDRIIAKMRYRRRVREEVREELVAHFEDELQGCRTAEKKRRRAAEVIEGFGDPAILAVLLRRAKKRCRPLWCTIVVRTFQTVGVLLLCLVIYGLWFSMGRPTIAIDYVALLNKVSRPEPADEDNAWPLLEKAAALYVEPDEELRDLIPEVGVFTRSGGVDFNSLPEQQRIAVAEHIRRNERAWAEFIAAGSKPYCYQQYGFDANYPERFRCMFNLTMPYLPKPKDLARIGLWRSRMEVARGRMQEGLDNCLAVARVGKHLQTMAMIVEQLVGISISQLAHEEILWILDCNELTVEQLGDLQQKLSGIYARGGYPSIDFEAEKLAFRDLVQRLFTQGGLGGGHLIPPSLVEFTGTWFSGTTGGDEERVFMIPVFTAMSMMHARRDETLRVGNRVYDKLARLAAMTPYQRHCKDDLSADSILASLPRRRFFVLHLVVPALDRASEIAFRHKALHEAVLTIIALRRWRAEKGRYPALLDELVAAGYLAELPMDPYSDKPLVYKPAEGTFTLYSLGLNFKDDSGQPGRDREGRATRRWLKTGDAVFWPIAAGKNH